MSLRNLGWFAGVVLVGVMFFGLAPIASEQDAVYRTFGPVVEVEALIRKSYVNDVDRGELVDGAIRGMVARLDPYSGYVSADEMAAFERRHTATYVGIGVELGAVDGTISVIAPIAGGPADRAGVSPGNIVAVVDGRSTHGLTLVDVERLLAGDEGASVTMTLRRGRTDVEVVLTREEIRATPVEGFARSADGAWDYFADRAARIGYIRIVRFTEGTAAEFDAALKKLVDDGAVGLVIDLRNNPGGLMNEAVAVTDRFLESGVILTTVTRREAIDTYHASPGAVDAGLRLAVLINGSSASSSEIVAGALQDHHRAVVVGQRSFGKGSVQDFIRVGGGRAGLKLTVAYYQLPGGRIIHRAAGGREGDSWGITPDVLVQEGETPNVDAQLRVAVERLSRGAS